MNCSGVFEYGQCYVALSRCTNPDNMRIINFKRRYLKIHPRVHNFVNELTVQLESTKKRKSSAKRRKRATLTSPPKKTIKPCLSAVLTDEKENVDENAQASNSARVVSPKRSGPPEQSPQEQTKHILVPETPQASSEFASSGGFIPETPEPVTIPETPEESSCTYEESQAY